MRSAVLLFGVPEAKLAQPRNVMGGTVLSATIGVCVRLALRPPLLWLGSALGMSLALLAMQARDAVYAGPALGPVLCWAVLWLGSALGMSLALLAMQARAAMLAGPALGAQPCWSRTVGQLRVRARERDPLSAPLCPRLAAVHAHACTAAKAPLCPLPNPSCRPLHAHCPARPARAQLTGLTHPPGGAMALLICSAEVLPPWQGFQVGGRGRWWCWTARRAAGSWGAGWWAVVEDRRGRAHVA
jgi:hypothetical protein